MNGGMNPRKGSTMKPTISVQGLKKKYGKVRALCGVDLKVEAGLIYGLLGPNGAGKSTLIKSMVGALKPSAGSVSIPKRLTIFWWGVPPVYRNNGPMGVVIPYF